MGFTLDAEVDEDGILREDVGRDNHRPAFSAGAYEVVWTE